MLPFCLSQLIFVHLLRLSVLLFNNPLVSILIVVLYLLRLCISYCFTSFTFLLASICRSFTSVLASITTFLLVSLSLLLFQRLWNFFRPRVTFKLKIDFKFFAPKHWFLKNELHSGRFGLGYLTKAIGTL